MRFFIPILFSLSTFIFSQTYCAGDQVSIEDQNFEFEVCYGSGDYSVGDNWSLSDFNGDLNGGDYHIIFIDMSASW
tara:strand:- start:899 stop:1126 length:228 start_codon:yes stop_codon:yes gene_type:complete